MMIGTNDLKARIYATCDPTSGDFCCTEDELHDLQTEVQQRIDRLQEENLSDERGRDVDMMVREVGISGGVEVFGGNCCFIILLWRTCFCNRVSGFSDILYC